MPGGYYRRGKVKFVFMNPGSKYKMLLRGDA